jgi:hypothetical protein
VYPLKWKTFLKKQQIMPLWSESLSAAKIRYYFGFHATFPVAGYNEKMPIPVIFNDLYYFCSQNTKKNEYKCQVGKVEDSPETAQALGQARTNGT